MRRWSSRLHTFFSLFCFLISNHFYWFSLVSLVPGKPVVLPSYWWISEWKRKRRIKRVTITMNKFMWFLIAKWSYHKRFWNHKSVEKKERKRQRSSGKNNLKYLMTINRCNGIFHATENDPASFNRKYTFALHRSLPIGMMEDEYKLHIDVRLNGITQSQKVIFFLLLFHCRVGNHHDVCASKRKCAHSFDHLQRIGYIHKQLAPSCLHNMLWRTNFHEMYTTSALNVWRAVASALTC